MDDVKGAGVTQKVQNNDVRGSIGVERCTMEAVMKLLISWAAEMEVDARVWTSGRILFVDLRLQCDVEGNQYLEQHH